MDINDFQKHALSTAILAQKDVATLSHRGFGLTAETGLIAQTIKKIIRDKNGVADAEDIQEIKKRLGDVLYYTAVLAEYYDLQLADIAKDNMEQSTEFKESRQ